ncbi:MAG TPA: prolyl oligopeptidase family serine peptidase, partial [Candidatus Thermoplasmatota archaeon]|nr:prolyl oligopeptidase family serine peptidase [Candidatus Thermoplasmatota archaeon]
GQPAHGWVGVPPSGTGTVLVVLAKGLATDATAWRGLMEDLAEAGALSLAMEYRGAASAWKVRAAAADTLAATLAVQQAHPEVRRTILYGVSMGGEASGLLLARAPPGTFTHWLAGGGVMDLASEWDVAVSFRPLIEAEAGGTPAQVPHGYAALSPLAQAPAIAAHGLRRAYLVHGAADTVVPADQADRMAQALARAGVPVSHIVVVSEPGAWVCTPALVACVGTSAPVAPASHEAGASQVALALLRGLVAGRPEPDAPFQRTWVEGGSGVTVEA